MGASRLLVGMVALGLVACGETHGNEDASSLAALGERCTEDSACAEGVCLEAGICSRPCSAGTDCPAAPWSCTSLPGRGSVCDCVPEDADVACNGTDDDCDGAVDETAITCGETCVDGAIDPSNCGGCGVVCGGGTACIDGTCGCPSGAPDVCGSRCVDLMSDLENCGRCGEACAAEAPALPACRAGACALDCSAAGGFDDCDLAAANGCETNLANDPAHCGGCGVACDFAHGSGACMTGRCEVELCEPGFGDCDADGTNGCETDLAISTDHCSACGLACRPTNGTGRCNASTCEIASCEPGYDDCNLDADDGCEIDTRSDAAHCSECGRACPGSGRPNTVASCAAGACMVSCVGGFGDCDGSTTSGCETRVSTDPTHCGRCDVTCTAGQLCRDGMCTDLRFTGATGSAWENLGTGGLRYPGFSDYTPASGAAIFARTGAWMPRFARLALPGTAWTTPAEGSDDGDAGYFAGPAWVGDALYVIVSGNVRRYDIPAGTWSTPLTGIGMAARAQATHDDTGHVYAVTTDGRLVTYDVASNTVSYSPLGLTTLGPRLAWDSFSRLLYLAPDYSTSSLYAVSPTTGVVSPLRPLPTTRFTPTFCSDRSGHLYAAGDSGGNTWQYDVATDDWRTITPVLPFPHNANGACTVTDDGYLYVTDDGTRLARLPLL